MLSTINTGVSVFSAWVSMQMKIQMTTICSIFPAVNDF